MCLVLKIKSKEKYRQNIKQIKNKTIYKINLMLNEIIL